MVAPVKKDIKHNVSQFFVVLCVGVVIDVCNEALFLFLCEFRRPNNGQGVFLRRGRLQVAWRVRSHPQTRNREQGCGARGFIEAKVQLG